MTIEWQTGHGPAAPAQPWGRNAWSGAVPIIDRDWDNLDDDLAAARIEVAAAIIDRETPIWT